MIQALMTWQAVKAFAARIPWQAWVAAGLLAAIPVNGCVQYRKGYSAGREAVLADLRTAEAEAAQKALEAAATATQAGIERAERFDAQQETLSDAIRKAEDANQNSLDALF